MGSSDGFSDSGFEVPDFYFRHHLTRRHLELRYGQMVIDSQFDSQSLGGSKSAFLNRAFASDPAVAFPRLGAGLTAAWDPPSRWDVTAGVTTVQGTATGRQVDFQFGSDDLFRALQFGYDLQTEKDGPGPQRLQLLLWDSDAVEETGQDGGRGLSLTYEHAFERWRNAEAFARLAWADGEATDARFLLSGAVAAKIDPQSRLGLGAALGRSALDGDWQTVVESFYRRSIGEAGEVSLDAQLLAGEGFEGGGALRLVLGAGARFKF